MELTCALLALPALGQTEATPLSAAHEVPASLLVRRPLTCSGFSLPVYPQDLDPAVHSQGALGAAGSKPSI